MALSAKGGPGVDRFYRHPRSHPELRPFFNEMDIRVQLLLHPRWNREFSHMDNGVKVFRHSIPKQPGHYRFRKHVLMPWLAVDVFKDSAERPDTLRLRCAGLTLPVNSWFENGVWEGPLR